MNINISFTEGDFLGNLFDFNHNRKLGTLEKVADFTTLINMMDSMDAEEPTSELKPAGLNETDLEYINGMRVDKR